MALINHRLFEKIFKGTGLKFKVPDNLFVSEIKDSGEGESVEDLLKRIRSMGFRV